MDRRTKLSILVIGLLLGSLMFAYVASQAPLDPLAEFRTADGGVAIPGGQFTPQLQALLFPSPAPTTYWTYAPARSSYQTIAVVGMEHDIVRTERAEPEPLRPVGTDSFKSFFDALLRLPSGIVSFFQSLSPFGTAAAADKFGVFDDVDCTETTISTDTDCWATTSGGTDVTTVPGAGDNIILDAASTGVVTTGTMNALLNITTGTFNSTGFTGTFAVAGSTFQNTGTFTHAGGTITIGAGTFQVGAATVSAAFTLTDGGGGIGDLRFTAGLTLSGSTITFNAGGGNLIITGNLTMSGGDIVSGQVITTVSGNVNISSASSAINFSASAWTISGTWTNSSTDTAVWSAGSGNALFDSATGGTMTFGGANLNEAEFSQATFASSAATPQTFTMATRNLMVSGTIIISDVDVTDSTTLNAGTLDLSFNELSVGADGGAILLMNGVSITKTVVDGVNVLIMNTSSGTIALTALASFQLTGDTDIRWTFNPSVASASVTVQVSGLVVGRAYTLLRDNENVVTADANGSGQVTLTVSDGWSSHDMRIIFASSAGGGGNGNGNGGLILPALPVTAIGMAFGWLAVGALAVIALMHLFRAARGWGYRFAWIVFVASAVLWFWLIYGMR
jgi:hypothetical protein